MLDSIINKFVVPLCVTGLMAAATPIFPSPWYAQQSNTSAIAAVPVEDYIFQPGQYVILKL